MVGPGLLYELALGSRRRICITWRGMTRHSPPIIRIVPGPTHTSFFTERMAYNKAILRNNGLFINPHEACISDWGRVAATGGGAGRISNFNRATAQANVG